MSIRAAAWSRTGRWSGWMAAPSSLTVSWYMRSAAAARASIAVLGGYCAWLARYEDVENGRSVLHISPFGVRGATRGQTVRLVREGRDSMISWMAHRRYHAYTVAGVRYGRVGAA